MKWLIIRSLFIFLVISLPVVSVLAQTKDIEVLRQINVDLNNSTLTKDTVAQDHIFADDMLLTNPAGETYNKKQLLRRLAAGPRLLSLKIDSVSIRVINNIGLVNCKVTGTFTADGTTQSVQTSYLDVYEKRKGNWVEIAAHVTVLGSK